MSEEPEDSLQALERIIELENELDFDIPEEDAERITTVAQALEYLKKRREPPAP